MSAYLFVFGRSHELSFHELSALFPDPITIITSDVARVDDFQESIDPKQLIHNLGGTVKIAREIGRIDRVTPEIIAPFLEEKDGAVTFGLSSYGTAESVNTELLKGIKNILLAKGIRGRYVAAHEGQTLSSVVIAKQRVHELIVVAFDSGFIVGETIVVQDFELWNQRDYGRPFADPKAGMLPPKVARIVVNLAMRDIPAFEPGSTLKPTLLDPFCGMGTIVGEALLSGWNVIGSDQSEDVVEKAKKNLEWLTGFNPVNGQGSTLSQFQLLQCDATHISEKIVESSVDAIVTEPFMGSSNINVKIQNSQPKANQPMVGKFEIEEIKNTIKGLEKLYIGCLRDWQKVLKPGGKVVIALPQYAISGRTYFVKNVIDRCEILGYTVSAGPLSYSRPQAVVRRQFYILQKKGQ